MSLAEAFLGLSFLRPKEKRIKPSLMFFPTLTFNDYMKKFLKKQNLKISEPLF